MRISLSVLSFLFRELYDVCVRVRVCVSVLRRPAQLSFKRETVEK